MIHELIRLTDEVPGKGGCLSGTNGKAPHNGGVPRTNGSVNGKAKANGKALLKTTSSEGNPSDKGGAAGFRQGVPQDSGDNTHAYKIHFFRCGHRCPVLAR